MATTRKFLSGSRIAKFEMLQHVLVPRSIPFSEEEKSRGIFLVNQILEDKSAVIHLKLALFMNLILIWSLLKERRSFVSLNSAEATQVLNSFFNSPIALFRKGFWGLNTLAKLTVYGQHELNIEFGYHLRGHVHE